MSPSPYAPPEPLDLHAGYLNAKACGKSLAGFSFGGITAIEIDQRLRGIRACAAVLIAEEECTLDLGDRIRAGLIEAIDALSADAERILGIADRDAKD